MIIQFNMDKTISGREKDTVPFTVQIDNELSRFSSKITRIEVHHSDDNGKKDSLNDIRCLMEARLEERQPISVSNQSDTSVQAVSDAIEKLVAALETITGREREI